MSAQFNEQRRNPLKSTCTLAGAAAVVSPGGSLNAFAAGGAMPLPPAQVFPNRVSSDKIPAEMKQATVEGTMAYSAVCTHLGCMLSNWDAATKQYLYPCHTDGATSRTLPHFPVKSVDGKLVVAGKPSGYVGVKRG